MCVLVLVRLMAEELAEKGGTETCAFLLGHILLRRVLVLSVRYTEVAHISDFQSYGLCYLSNCYTEDYLQVCACVRG